MGRTLVITRHPTLITLGRRRDKETLVTQMHKYLAPDGRSHDGQYCRSRSEDGEREVMESRDESQEVDSGEQHQGANLSLL